MRAIINFGNAIGLIFLVQYSDNGNRRKSMLISIVLMIVGSAFLLLSDSLVLICINLFIFGLGMMASIKMGFTILNEIV